MNQHLNKNQNLGIVHITKANSEYNARGLKT